jgi:hypothetical protein
MKVIAVAVGAALVTVPVNAISGDFWLISNGKKGPEFADAESVRQ